MISILNRKQILDLITTPLQYLKTEICGGVKANDMDSRIRDEALSKRLSALEKSYENVINNAKTELKDIIGAHSLGMNQQVDNFVKMNANDLLNSIDNMLGQIDTINKTILHLQKKTVFLENLIDKTSKMNL